MDADVIVLGAALAGLLATHELARGGKKVVVIPRVPERPCAGARAAVGLDRRLFAFNASLLLSPLVLRRAAMTSCPGLCWDSQPRAGQSRSGQWRRCGAMSRSSATAGFDQLDLFPHRRRGELPTGHCVPAIPPGITKSISPAVSGSASSGGAVGGRRPLANGEEHFKQFARSEPFAIAYAPPERALSWLTSATNAQGR